MEQRLRKKARRGSNGGHLPLSLIMEQPSSIVFGSGRNRGRPSVKHGCHMEPSSFQKTLHERWEKVGYEKETAESIISLGFARQLDTLSISFALECRKRRWTYRWSPTVWHQVSPREFHPDNVAQAATILERCSFDENAWSIVCLRGRCSVVWENLTTTNGWIKYEQNASHPFLKTSPSLDTLCWYSVWEDCTWRQKRSSNGMIRDIIERINSTLRPTQGDSKEVSEEMNWITSKIWETRSRLYRRRFL